MDYLEAELDLASIDKVDVRNELRRFTVFPATGTDFDFFGSLLQPKVAPLLYNCVLRRPDTTRPSRSVTLGCHAPMVGVPQG